MNNLIIQRENIELIVSSAPAAYTENTVSHDRCLEAGRKLLSQMQQGMTDELDQQAAIFIEKARKTVRKMNDKRSSITKLFDDIRSTFTTMENDIDPSKSQTIPFLIQTERNRYAAKKREEEMCRQQEVLRQQQMEQAKKAFRQEYDNAFRQGFNDYLSFNLDGLRNLFNTVDLDNYEQRLQEIQNMSTTLDESAVSTVQVIRKPLISPEDAESIRSYSISALLPLFQQEYKKAMSDEKDLIIQLMPSKRQTLELAAKASAEEAERIRQQIKERDEAEAARLEQERLQREQQQRMEADMRAKQSEMDGLFNQAAAAKPAYQPNTSVKKRIVPMNVEAFPEIISLWWSEEGCRLTIEELSKMFKKQITFCERLAKEGKLIQSEHIYYEDEVKAK